MDDDLRHNPETVDVRDALRNRIKLRAIRSIDGDLRLELLIGDEVMADCLLDALVADDHGG